ncbi:MAG: GTP 3',8-cyclase MoaA [Planctomycetes bacterium]|nr:GTP 3',8-cyclase MoaA [Planctomycetota bacterium]
MTVTDRHGRELRNLRLSVTDRCNLRCSYCMPEEEYGWLPKRDILDFEELSTLVDAFLLAGVDKVRLTGGEPLVRRDVEVLVGLLAQKRGITDLALTTNGILLGEHAAALKRAGLGRVTVSLDTLRPERFLKLTRRDSHADVLAGLEAARAAGFTHTKIDSVILRGTNDDELAALIEHGKQLDAEVRFIEYMDVGGATNWSMDEVLPKREMLERLRAEYGPILPLHEHGSAPAERFLLPDGTVFGIIASTTEPFCARCDRSRVTADGTWFQCLYARIGVDLRAKLRAGATREELAALIQRVWTGRTDRGAEVRLAEHERGALAPRDELVQNVHLEMHKRGG